MSSYQYERLSRQDNDFLVWESAKLPMHVGGVQIFDAGPLRKEHGGIDFDAIKRLTASALIAGNVRQAANCASSSLTN